MANQEDCPHDVHFAQMCAVCGKVLQDDENQDAIPMLHGPVSLTVSTKQAAQLEEETKQRLLSTKKLSLVLDLDHTLVHAATNPAMQLPSPLPPDVHVFTLPGSSMNYYIKCRPRLAEFLEGLKSKFEVHLYTMGTRAYATKVASLIDPTSAVFNHRILSRDDCKDMNFKNLKRLFPFDDSMVLIVDDRDDVWNRSQNLIKVDPYLYFLGCAEVNGPAGSNMTAAAANTQHSPPKPATVNEKDKEDTALVQVHDVLNEVHRIFYKHVHARSETIDVKTILRDIKQNVLKGVCILFSGVFPIQVKPQATEIWALAEMFGAKCEVETSSKITHLIAQRAGTDKTRWAQKAGIFIVSPPWLYTSIRKWKRAEEYQFPVENLPVRSHKHDNKKTHTANGNGVHQTTSTPTNGLQEIVVEEQIIEVDDLAELDTEINGHHTDNSDSDSQSPHDADGFSDNDGDEDDKEDQGGDSDGDGDGPFSTKKRKASSRAVDAMDSSNSNDSESDDGSDGETKHPKKMSHDDTNGLTNDNNEDMEDFLEQELLKT
jgi:RNA polymerase II subunit A-like phosphatase